MKIEYMLKDSNGLLKGTAVTRCEPTNDHEIAKAICGSNGGGIYVTALGSDKVVFLSEWGILSDYHPDHPRYSGKLQVTDVVAGIDSLPGEGLYRATLDTNSWPETKLSLCFSPKFFSDETANDEFMEELTDFLAKPNDHTSLPMFQSDFSSGLETDNGPWVILLDPVYLMNRLRELPLNLKVG